jgi:RimJ/RimL family protein N-acetyltransferase
MIEPLTIEPFALTGSHIRLEPLEARHAEGLAAASAVDPSLYGMSPIPQGVEQARAYIETALAWRKAGTAIAFATIRRSDDAVLGSTRFWNVERWAWTPESPHFNARAFDVCEIGWTWLTAGAIRTAANTEAKLLMMTHAFEIWRVLRICFHTDVRNHRSAAALERIGGRFEGVIRAHRIAADRAVRDSKRFSILAAEWPEVKRGLTDRLKAGGS